MAVMKRDSILNIFLTVSVLICLCHGRYVNVPQSVTAVKGSCVTLPCSTSSHSHVIWYQYVSGRDPIVYSTNYGDITDHFRGRTSAPGSSSQGDCSLRIYRVRQGDNSEKLYPWIQPDTGNDYHLVQIYIVNPENPHISIDNQQVEGKLFSATCSIRHSCPSSPPPVEWIGLSTVSNSEPTTKEQGGLWTTVFQAKFKPSLQDHEKYLRCQSIFSSQTTYSNAATVFFTDAPSDVRIQAEGNSVVEGGSLSLKCSATSRPPPSHYEWSVSQMDTTVKYSGKEHRYTLKNIQRETSVSCTVFNSVGQGQSEQLKLNVHYAPSDVRIQAEGNNVVEGGSLSLKCSATSRPPPSRYEWSVSQMNTTVNYSGTEHRYTLKNIQRETSVSCTVFNSVGEGQSEQLKLNVHYAPSDVRIQAEGNSVVEGGSLSLTCSAASRPPPSRYEWSVSQMNTTVKKSGAEHRYTFKNILRETSVSCTVFNSVGRGQSEQLKLNVHCKLLLLLFCL
ncbi:B-cell receptor CD22-like isoform X1 [Astyanax mexicanus]|uniref:B-cell receptor CD22-like isoform X1 n=1 Tax=Astyanax mexicanus TaxID=7994 RepID=A0A8T2MHM2_ASTMX|nr:B-cell receptor CD22-like isoform X1 [Astyanax mexicanus]